MDSTLTIEIPTVRVESCCGTLAMLLHATVKLVVYCKLCKKLNYTGNTTNLSVHLQQYHRKEFAKLKQASNSGPKARIRGKAMVRDAKQPLIGEAFQAQGPMHAVQHCGNKQLIDVMCYFLVKDKHVFDTVNDAGFRHLV